MHRASDAGGRQSSLEGPLKTVAPGQAEVKLVRYTPSRMRARMLLPVLASALVIAGPLGADSVCDIAGVPRLVAVGDVHGSHDNLVKVLQMAGVVDAKLRWAAGKAHLVQNGDMLDRGSDSRKVMDLLMRLEGEARRAGGRVHALLGNHEVMNMLGDLRYVSAGEYEAFRTERSEQMRERYYHQAAGEAERQAKAAGQPFDRKAFREQFLKDVPLGWVEHRQAFGQDGHYGRWLRKHDAVVKINGVVFVHGGLTPEVAALGCAAINETVRRELSQELQRTRSAPLESLAGRESGPLWYRGLAREDEQALGPALEQVLRSLQARAVVIGHTVTETGRIVTRFGGRVVMIDVGMLPAFGGHLAALELGPEGMTALYPTGREVLERRAAALALAP